MHLGNRFRAVALASAALFVAAACGGTSGPGTVSTGLSAYTPKAGVQGGQLVYSDWESVQDLNVLSSTAATTQEVASGPLWASLWVFDPKNNAIPDLVTEVPTVANGDVKAIDSTHMDVTIKLKPGLKWSDGQPLTTADLDFTIAAICDPAAAAGRGLPWRVLPSAHAGRDAPRQVSPATPGRVKPWHRPGHARRLVAGGHTTHDVQQPARSCAPAVRAIGPGCVVAPALPGRTGSGDPRAGGLGGRARDGRAGPPPGAGVDRDRPDR